MTYHHGMARVRYVEVACKSAINRVHGMPFPWSLNPYRGCRHACRYCYARTTHAFLGLDAGADFDSVIYAKTNVAQALAHDLRRPSWRGEAVAVGTATDPYQPAEGRYRLTRACLEVFAEHGNPANVTTKGTLVVRDVDVLRDLAGRAGCGVNVSLITLDDAVWRAFEPATPPPMQRLRALSRLSAAGVPCGLALAPVLPRLTDAPASLRAVIQAAADHGARWLWSGTLHLEPAVRDWFLDALARYFPSQVPDYVRVFGTEGEPGGARYAPKAYAEALGARVREVSAAYGLGSGHLPARRVGEPAEGPARAARSGSALGPSQPALPL